MSYSDYEAAEADETYLQGAIEALLFVTDEPVNVLTLADALQVDPRKIEAALDALQTYLKEGNRGIQLHEVAGGWRLVTHPQYHRVLSEYVISWDTRKLSQAALETLAIVAYCQPVTRNEISSIRGVSSDSSVASLLDKGLLREVGVQDSAGNPTLYATSKTFLEKFGLKNVGELPDLEGFAPDEETKALISERLQVVRSRTGYEESLYAEDNSSVGLDAQEAQGETELPVASGDVQKTMHELLKDRLASSVGVVDKINFDELVFEEDDDVFEGIDDMLGRDDA